MRIHVVGLGKLGLPVAVALEQAGHEVSGWEIDASRRGKIRMSLGRGELWVSEVEHEPRLGAFLAQSHMRLCKLEDAGWVDLILICVQTPHEPQFEGLTPLEEAPRDFDYRWLQDAVGETVETVMSQEYRNQHPLGDPLLVTVSTCLPGTYRKYIRPIIGGKVRYAYMPLFIAMGSVIDDFYNPEFVLCGTEQPRSFGPPAEIAVLHQSIIEQGAKTKGLIAPALRDMSVTSAELTKVAYNAFLGFKLMLANGIAMTCDAVGADADDVMATLMSANKRLISRAYLSPGMGDGGGCHPRDQIALSWLAGDIGLEHDPYRVVIDHREAHARWLGDLLWRAAMDHGVPPIILGRAYKKNSTLTTGSHGLLVQHHVTTKYGYEVPCEDHLDRFPVAAYLIAMPHDHFVGADIPDGSVIIDPWGWFPAPRGVEVIRPGRRSMERSKVA